jgi:glycosyltransferase involved in cell wall biosynthesis
MSQTESHRVAWLLPAMGNGGLSFQHLLCEFTKVFPETVTFTGQWSGFVRGLEDTFRVKEIGSTQYIEFGKMVDGYTVGFSFASPKIIYYLLRFKPQVVFANSFTAWTAIALLLKPIAHWKVIITYEGGSDVYENTSSIVRYQTRRWMVRLADAFVVNGRAGKSYFLDVLDAKPERLFAKPFLLPSPKALQQYSEIDEPQLDDSLPRPIFLFVGQIIPRKGLKTLLEACLQLKQQGFIYTLMVVGYGEQQRELEEFVQQHNLQREVNWVGKIPYHRLGAYFKFSDVFVFPTYDDIWGMVLTEAMVFGKPVICSVAAGAVEMVDENVNGFIYEPTKPEQLVQCMTQFLDLPELVKTMGERSANIMANAENISAGFLEAMDLVQKHG